MKIKDRIGGIIFIVFGITVALLATQIRMPNNLNEPGPRIFPYISGIGMALCGLGMAVTAKKSDGEPFLTKDAWKRLLAAGAVLVLYYLALEFLGFLISTPFFIFAIVMLLAGENKPKAWRVVIVAVAVTAILYLLFQKVFILFLPAGKLF